MKHPRIPDHPMQTGSSIPWSAEGEERLRELIAEGWKLMWAGIVGGACLGLLAVIWRRPMLLGATAVFWMGAVSALFVISRLREKLGMEMQRLRDGSFFEGYGMLANKPRSTQQLTVWISHRTKELAFECECGRAHVWRVAKWIPNFDPEQFGEDPPAGVDPAGGRYVILCPCTLGHFKLKAQT